jgi:hypothetical protein
MAKTKQEGNEVITAEALVARAVLSDGNNLTVREAQRVLGWVCSVFGDEDADYCAVPLYAVAMALASETHLLESGRELTYDETWHLARLVAPSALDETDLYDIL